MNMTNQLPGREWPGLMGCRRRLQRCGRWPGFPVRRPPEHGSKNMGVDKTIQGSWWSLTVKGTRRHFGRYPGPARDMAKHICRCAAVEVPPVVAPPGEHEACFVRE